GRPALTLVGSGVLAAAMVRFGAQANCVGIDGVAIPGQVHTGEHAGLHRRLAQPAVAIAVADLVDAVAALTEPAFAERRAVAGQQLGAAIAQVVGNSLAVEPIDAQAPRDHPCDDERYREDSLDGLHLASR